MRPGEMAITCVAPGCGRMTSSYGFDDCGKIVPLCWTHKLRERMLGATRLGEAVACPTQGLARLDRGRSGGDCLCECGRKYYDHPQDADHPFLNVLCDGSVVKL